MPQTPNQTPQPTEQYPQGVAERVLVVEDDKAIRALVTTTLESNGIPHLWAANGHDAIAEATRANPDIMLLDLGLPDMDGVDVIRTVRQWSMLPIIVLYIFAQRYIIKGMVEGAVKG